MKAVDAHYARLSDRLGWAITPPEATINALGYATIADRQIDEGLEYLEANVRNYPDSANAYDSLGEGLEAAGRLDDALAKYEEAIKRAEADKDPLLDIFRAHRDAARKKIAERRN